MENPARRHPRHPTRNILASKENKAGTTIVSKYDYIVNVIGQRTNVNTSGTAFPATPSWAWGYDSLAPVTKLREKNYERRKSSKLYLLVPEDRRSAPPNIPLRAVTGAASLRGHVTCAV